MELLLGHLKHYLDMKSLIYCLILLPIALKAQTIESDHKWEKIILEEAACQLWAPGPLQKKTKAIETRIGEVVYHTFLYQEQGKGPENYFYMLSYCDYPEGTVHSDSLELINDFFKSTIETATYSVDGKLIYTAETSINDFPGRFWRINYLDNQVVIKTRAYLVKNRYYAIQTIMHKDRSLNASSDRFLESFALLP